MTIKTGNIVTLHGEASSFTYKVIEANEDRFLVTPVFWEAGISPVDLVYSEHIESVLN